MGTSDLQGFFAKEEKRHSGSGCLLLPNIGFNVQGVILTGWILEFVF